MLLEDAPRALVAVALECGEPDRADLAGGLDLGLLSIELEQGAEVDGLWVDEREGREQQVA